MLKWIERLVDKITPDPPFDMAFCASIVFIPVWGVMLPILVVAVSVYRTAEPGAADRALADAERRHNDKIMRLL